MMVILVTALAATVAAVAATRLLASLVIRPVLRGRNHRGLELPVGSGIAVLGGALLGWGTLALIGDAAGAPETSRALRDFALLALGFGFLGLYDDLAGAGQGRGWKSHLGAIKQGRPTPGALKIVGGLALALIVARAGDGLVWGIARAALIALSANLVNLLDVRPGRATKVFTLAALLLGCLSAVVAAPLAVAAAAALACLRADLRERVMLGDVGANALGAIAGAAAAIHASHVALSVALAVLALLHVIADRPGLSAIIDRVPPLRAADRAGRAVVG